MNKVFKIKRMLHVLVNNVFYVVVFLVGFICGLFNLKIFEFLGGLF